jgi:hypothetical protein
LPAAFSGYNKRHKCQRPPQPLRRSLHTHHLRFKNHAVCQSKGHDKRISHWCPTNNSSNDKPPHPASVAFCLRLA